MRLNVSEISLPHCETFAGALATWVQAAHHWWFRDWDLSQKAAMERQEAQGPYSSIQITSSWDPGIPSLGSELTSEGQADGSRGKNYGLTRPPSTKFHLILSKLRKSR